MSIFMCVCGVVLLGFMFNATAVALEMSEKAVMAGRIWERKVRAAERSILIALLASELRRTISSERAVRERVALKVRPSALHSLAHCTNGRLRTLHSLARSLQKRLAQNAHSLAQFSAAVRTTVLRPHPRLLNTP